MLDEKATLPVIVLLATSYSNKAPKLLVAPLCVLPYNLPLLAKTNSPITSPPPLK